MIYEPYTDVPNLVISSNCIRLLNVVGQGNLNTKGFVCVIIKTLDMFCLAVMYVYVNIDSQWLVESCM